MTNKSVILIVENNPALALVYEQGLRDDFEVRVANNREDALSQLDTNVDVVLLDRRMPGKSGDSVLQAIYDRDLPCRVAMISAVEPDFHIVDMGFDDYLVKLTTNAELTDTVEKLLKQASYESTLREYFSLARKKALLEAEKSRFDLRDNEEYETLNRNITALKSELKDALDQFDHDDFQTACSGLLVTPQTDTEPVASERDT